MLWKGPRPAAPGPRWGNHTHSQQRSPAFSAGAPGRLRRSMSIDPAREGLPGRGGWWRVPALPELGGGEMREPQRPLMPSGWAVFPSEGSCSLGEWAGLEAGVSHAHFSANEPDANPASARREGGHGRLPRREPGRLPHGALVPSCPDRPPRTERSADGEVPGGGNPAEGGGRLELWAGQGSVSEAHRASAPRPGSLSRSAAELRPEPGSREPSWAFPAQGAQLASWGG